MVTYKQFEGYSVLVDVEDGLALLVTEDSEGTVDSQLVEVQEDVEESS